MSAAMPPTIMPVISPCTRHTTESGLNQPSPRRMTGRSPRLLSLKIADTSDAMACLTGAMIRKMPAVGLGMG